MEEITNTQLMAKLIEIEGMLEKISKDESKIIREEKRIEIEEGAQLDILGTLSGANDKRKYSVIADWKINIWDSCPDKEEKSTDDDIDFHCKQSNRNCRFNDCPRNI